MKLFYHSWHSGNSGHSLEQGKDSTSLTPNFPKLVLLHGLGGTGNLWRPIAAGLENQMAVLAPDQRGHGKSRVPQSHAGDVYYTPEAFGQDLIDTLSAIDFHPTWGVGHSMGVRSLTAAAHLRPEYFQGLILVDLGLSGLAGGGLGVNLSQFLKLLPPQFASREKARAFMTAHCPDPSIGQYLLAVATKHADGSVEFPFDHEALLQTLDSARNFNIRDWILDLGRGGMPIRLLRGQKSLVWRKEEFDHEREAFRNIPNVEFHEIPNAGHGLPFEQRALFVEFVRKNVLG